MVRLTASRSRCVAKWTRPKRTSRVRPPQGDEGCHRHPWAICPAEATSSLTDGALSSVSHLSCGGHVPVVIWWGGCVVPPHVVVVVVHGPFVLRRPCHHRCPVGASSSSSMGLLSCRGLVPVVVVVGPCDIVVVQWGPPPCRSLLTALAASSSSSSSLPGEGFFVIIVVGPH